MVPTKETGRWFIFARNQSFPALTAYSGKWLLYFNRRDIDRVWASLAAATHKGELGPVSKCATSLSARCSTYSRDPQTHVVCVYCADGRNAEDVQRIATRLAQILHQQLLPCVPFYWKSDRDTIEQRYPPDERTIAYYCAVPTGAGGCQIGQMRRWT